MERAPRPLSRPQKAIHKGVDSTHRRVMIAQSVRTVKGRCVTLRASPLTARPLCAIAHIADGSHRRLRPCLCLSKRGLMGEVELLRCDAPQCAVATTAVIETVDILKHSQPSVRASGICFQMQLLTFQATEEVFRHGVVIRVPFLAHGAGDIMPFEQVSKRVSAVLCPSV